MVVCPALSDHDETDLEGNESPFYDQQVRTTSDYYTRPMVMEDKKSELYLSIVRQISEGKLKEGDRLPSERQLASEYGITIRGVKSALEKLLKEEIISQEQGRGTFVRNVPESMTVKRIGLVHLTDLWADQNILFA